MSTSRVPAVVLAVAAATGLLAASAARAQGATRTLILVAHQDDDLAAAADSALRIQSGEPVRTVYLTDGSANLDCADYVRSRERGVKNVYAHLAGIPEAPDCGDGQQAGCWRASERVYAGKRMRLLELTGTSVSLGFLGFANPAMDVSAVDQPTLQRLWEMKGARVSNQDLDGRSVVDIYTKHEMIEALRALLSEFDPSHLVTLDPNRQQLLGYPFDHSDHVHTALFTFAALQRWGKPVDLRMEQGYHTMFRPVTRTQEEAELGLSLVDIYTPHDPKICLGEVTLCGEASPCFPPFLFDLAKLHFYTTEVAVMESTKVQTPGGLCLDSVGGWVFAAPCVGLSSTQHWQLQAGRIRHRQSGQCLHSENGSGVVLRPCGDTPFQRFSLLTNGALLGPDAQCMAVTAGWVGLETCAADLRQTGFGPH